MAEFVAAFAELGEPFAYVDEIQAFIYLEVARPSPCLRAPAGRDWPRDLPCTRPRALRSHSSQMQATEGDVGEAVEAFKIDHDENLRHYENQAREVRAQAPPCRAGRACWCLASFLHACTHISTCMQECMRACNYMRALAEPSRAPRSEPQPVSSSARLGLSLDAVSEGAYPAPVTVLSVLSVRLCVCVEIHKDIGKCMSECIYMHAYT